MNLHSPSGPERARGLWSLAWTLAVVSLGLTIVGAFWLRLWILGLVIGAVALVVGLVAARREGDRSLFTAPAVAAGALAVLVAVAVAGVSIFGAIVRGDAGPPHEELHVELMVRADGDFTVTHTEPPVEGASKATIVEIDATDEFEESFVTRLSDIQFFAAIAQNNIGPQSISCEIRINGTTVVDRTEAGRFIDCSSDLQNLYLEQVSE